MATSFTVDSTFQCARQMIQGLWALKRQGSEERGETETGPGLWGFVAKHLFRAGEFESTQEKGQTKNNPGVKQAESVCAVETRQQGNVEKKPES